MKIIYLCISAHDARAYASITLREIEHEDFKAVIYDVLEKELGVDTTELARRSMARADQLLQDMSVGKTENLLHALMHTSHQSYQGGTESIDQSYDESTPGTWS